MADGIAFSCSNTGKPEASLRYILKSVDDTVYKLGLSGKEVDVYKEADCDLKRWSNQGILMLNTALTTTITKVGQHYEMWKPFITFLLDMLNTYNCGLIYVFLGRQAKEWSDMVSEQNHKLFANHPAYAAYKKSKEWENDELFPKISELVEKYYKEKIIW